MKRQWENEELLEHWMLSVWDLAQLGNKTGATRLGFAVLLKFFQRAGRFPMFKNEVPAVVISFVATQIGVAPEVYLQYDWQGRTIKDHRADIRTLLDFRESTVADAEQMKHWLIDEVFPQEHQEERLREEAYAWFRRLHLEAPTPDRLTRVIRSAAHTFEQQLYDATLARLPEATRTALEALLSTEIANSYLCCFNNPFILLILFIPATLPLVTAYLALPQEVGVTWQSVYDFIADGKLHPIYLHGDQRLLRSEIEEWKVQRQQ